MTSIRASGVPPLAMLVGEDNAVAGTSCDTYSTSVARTLRPRQKGEALARHRLIEARGLARSRLRWCRRPCAAGFFARGVDQVAA
jgi:hypothetical protein